MSVAVPAPVMFTGLIVAVTFVGADAVNFTVPLNPFAAVTVIVDTVG